MLRAVILGATLLAAVYGQATTPLFDSSYCFTDTGNGERVVFIADAANSCVYWECLSLGSLVRLVDRKCGLGTAVSSFFGLSASAPCTESFDPTTEKFDCTRKKFDLEGTPPCYQEYIDQGTCKNEGRVVFELGICSCDCSGTGYADWDCSKTQADLNAVTRPSGEFNPDDPCPNGIPTRDWCLEAGGNPCLNNGQCVNQCTEYICLCVSQYTAGRNCEAFYCTENLECLNGGTCSRGPNNENQFATCECSPGYSGLMCEIAPVGK